MISGQGFLGHKKRRRIYWRSLKLSDSVKQMATLEEWKGKHRVISVWGDDLSNCTQTSDRSTGRAPAVVVTEEQELAYSPALNKRNTELHGKQQGSCSGPQAVKTVIPETACQVFRLLCSFQATAQQRETQTGPRASQRDRGAQGSSHL